MFKRLFNPLISNSFFIFGARGTGKSTWIREEFIKQRGSDAVLWLDLLDPALERRFALHPERLVQWVGAQPQKPKWVVIDEVQKVPKLLDIVHSMIETQGVSFVLSGSSARKLKRGASNLLAGRAFVNKLFPLSVLELGTLSASATSDQNESALNDILHWGLLPKIFSFQSIREKRAYLEAYVQTYFAEEIRAEQVIRKLDPFRAFLPILGQVSGKIINHKRIADEVGVSPVTIQSYFQIVEDTLLGFYLPAFHQSVRQSQRVSPKFYLFDTGVKKALEESLEQAVVPRTSVFGELFEAFFINEIVKLMEYHDVRYRLSFYATKHGAEIDLLLSKGQKNIAIEIKTTKTINESEVHSLERIAKDIPGLEKVFYLSFDPLPLKIGTVHCWHWLEFLKQIPQVLQ